MTFEWFATVALLLLGFLVGSAMFAAWTDTEPRKLVFTSVGVLFLWLLIGALVKIWSHGEF